MICTLRVWVLPLLVRTALSLLLVVLMSRERRSGTYLLQGGWWSGSGAVLASDRTGRPWLQAARRCLQGEVWLLMLAAVKLGSAAQVQQQQQLLPPQVKLSKPSGLWAGPGLCRAAVVMWVAAAGTANTPCGEEALPGGSAAEREEAATQVAHGGSLAPLCSASRAAACCFVFALSGV